MKKCEWHDAPKEQRKVFAGVRFIAEPPALIGTIDGPAGRIVRCTCDDATRRWRQANRPEDA